MSASEPDPAEPADPGGAAGAPPSRRPPRVWRSRMLLAVSLLALFAAMLTYKVLHAGGLEQTALFYVGLPALIALIVVFTARPRSPVGLALAVTTVGLALAGPLLNEGVVCLVMAAPLFYGLAALIGAAGRTHGRYRGPQALVGGALLLLLCLEGVNGLSYLPPAAEGQATKVVDASPEEVTAALSSAPSYAEPDSLFLNLGFPRPLRADGSGLREGDRREITFTPTRSLGLGARSQPHAMRLAVTESELGGRGGRVVFSVTGDSTLAHWMDLSSAEVTWQAVGGAGGQRGTELTWTLRYARTFAPSWYFGPLQRYGMDRAAGYLAETFAAEATANGTP